MATGPDVIRPGASAVCARYQGLLAGRRRQPVRFADQAAVPCLSVGSTEAGVRAAEKKHALLERYGEGFGDDLTREEFREVAEQQIDVRTEVFPRVSYRRDDRFGATQAHVVQADCSTRARRTFATFVSGL